MTAHRFGDLLKMLRKKAGLTLREFSRRLEKDPGNISKLERGILPPPRDEEAIKTFGRVLGLNEASEDMKQLTQLAAIDAGQIPNEVMQNEKLVSMLPIFFRTATGSKLDQKKIEAFLEKLRNT